MFSSFGDFLCRDANLLIFMVALPILCGFLLWLFRKNYGLKLAVAFISSVLNLIFALSLYFHSEAFVKLPFAPFGFEYSFRVYGLSSLFLVIAAAAFVLIGIYTSVYLKDIKYGGLYLFYLFAGAALVNGVLISDGLGTMLFFWEGLLCVLFGILLLQNRDNPKTAVKAMTIVGLSDLLLMLGVIITTHAAEASNISEMGSMPITGICLFGFICMMLGAIGQSGCIPFHSWLPDAAENAPTVFMAAYAGILQALLGIYLALRTVLDIYHFNPGTGLNTAIMIIGALTVVLASAMALAQNDIKRLIAYCAIGQSGFLILGIGSGLPFGYGGALYCLIDTVICMSGLFMLSGIIEKKAGTTDLRRIKGLRMPAAAVSLAVLSLSVAGFPGLSGFFSKQLLLGAVNKSGIVYYLCALLGVFLTALALLKMGRSLFSKPQKASTGKDKKNTSGTSAGMLVPVCILAALCLLFGILYSPVVNGLIKPALADSSATGWQISATASLIYVVILALAAADHFYGCKKSGSALKSTDHICCAAGIKSIYASAEKGRFDPYNWIMAAMNGYSFVCMSIEHGVSWFYDKGVPGLVNGTGYVMHRFVNGRLSRYLFLAVSGLAIIAVIFLIVLL